MPAIYPPSNASMRTIPVAAASTVLRAAPATLYGYYITNSAAGSAVTLTIFDNTTAAGTKILARIDVAATGGTSGLVLFPNPIQMTVGLSVTLTGGNLAYGWILAD
jgi:hypothetical protein